MVSNVSDIFNFDTFVHAFAGSLGGIFAMTLLYPFETVRSRLQVDNSNKFSNKSTFEVIQELVRQEGILTLYRGMESVLITMSTSNFVYFYCFHGLKQYSSINAKNDLIIGLASGIVNVFVTNPLWVVNNRLKMNGIDNRIKYSNLFSGLFHIIKTEGWRKLWSGLTPSLILVANPAIQFMVYEMLKRHLLVNLSPGDVHSIVYFTLGAVSKTVATFLTYPLQVVQTKLRYGLRGTHLAPNAGTVELLFYILKRRGFKGLFVGLEAKLLQTVLTAAVMFATYEKIVNFVFLLLRAKK